MFLCILAKLWHKMAMLYEDHNYFRGQFYMGPNLAVFGKKPPFLGPPIVRFASKCDATLSCTDFAILVSYSQCTWSHNFLGVVHTRINKHGNFAFESKL